MWSEGGGGEGEESVLPYDHLILCTGLQFTSPPVISDNDEEIPLIYDANEGLGVSEWTQKYLQSEGVCVCVCVYTCSPLPPSLPPSRPHPPVWLYH